MMKARSWFVIGFCGLAWALAGCGGGEDGGPNVMDLSGEWVGQYVSPKRQTRLSATITQENESVILETSLVGAGHLLTGTIETNGSLKLTDAFDGEIWTSLGPVSTTKLRIHDYFYDPTLGDDSPEQDIFLAR